MKTFISSILIGIGIGWLLAPMPGKEMRRLLGVRLQELRSSLPANEQVNQVSDRLSQTRSNVGESIQSIIGSVLKGNEGAFISLAEAATEVVNKATENGNLSQALADLLQLIIPAGKK